MFSKLTRGYSATEIIVTLGVVAALSGIGYGTTSQLKPRYQARKAAVEFNQAVATARQLATTNGVEARILLVEYDVNAADASAPNLGQYRIQLGNRSLNSDVWDTLPAEAGTADMLTAEGTVDLSAGSPQHLAGVSIEDWGTVNGPGAGNTDAIVFNPMGTLQNPASDMDAQGGIAVSFVNKKTVGAARPDRTTVRIYRGGMARLETQASAEAVADGSAASTTDGSADATTDTVSSDPDLAPADYEYKTTNDTYDTVDD